MNLHTPRGLCDAAPAGRAANDDPRGVHVHERGLGELLLVAAEGACVPAVVALEVLLLLVELHRVEEVIDKIVRVAALVDEQNRPRGGSANSNCWGDVDGNGTGEIDRTAPFCCCGCCCW